MAETKNRYPDALPAGWILDERYRIEETIGQGGFCTIYKVTNIVNGKIFALKEFFNLQYMDRNPGEGAEVVYSEENRKLVEDEKNHLLREARIIGDLAEDSSIVKVYDHFEENGTAYVVMEYIEGRTILDAIREEKAWDPVRVIKAFMPLMLAMDRIHDQNIIHRDLSPDNIMIREDGTLCILDFGSADKINSERSKHTAICKLGYTALELRNEDVRIGRYTDVFGLCGTMYYAMTGNTPLDAGYRRTFGDGEMYRPSDYGVKIKPAAEDILMRGLSLYPENRVPDMKALYEEFNKLYPNLSAEELKKKKKKRQKIAAAVTILAAAVLCALIVFLWNNRVAVRFGLIKTLKTRVEGKNMTDDVFGETLSAVTGRFEALGGEEGFLVRREEGKKAVFELPETGYNGVDPDYITENLLCRPINLFLYCEEPGTAESIAIPLPRNEIAGVSAQKEGIRIEPGAPVAETMVREAADKEQKLYLAFDSDQNEDGLKIEAKAEDDGSIFLIRDALNSIPDELLLYVITHEPLPDALSFECQKAINWEEPSASLMAGKNQVSESEIPGTAMLIYYRSPSYDPKKKGEELQFQYVLKNRLDCLRVPYAIGKEAFGDEIYIVKMTRGAAFEEEIETLGTEVELLLGDESGAGVEPLSGIEITKDPGKKGIIVSFDEQGREACIDFLRQKKTGGQERACLYFTVPSSNIAFAGCELTQALESLQNESRIRFDSFVIAETENAVQTPDEFLDYLIASFYEAPANSYYVEKIQVLDKENIPVIDGESDAAQALFAE